MAWRARKMQSVLAVSMGGASLSFSISHQKEPEAAEEIAPREQISPGIRQGFATLGQHVNLVVIMVIGPPTHEQAGKHQRKRAIGRVVGWLVAASQGLWERG